MIYKIAKYLKTIISDFLKRTYDTFKNKDIYNLIDITFIWSVIFVLIFLLLYKLVINVEDILSGTDYLVIPEKVKYSLPQFYFLFLAGLGFFKLIVNIRRRNIPESPITEQENDVLQIRVANFYITIQKENLAKILVICLLTLFILIKVPSWDLSFTVNHPLKYSTYAEPALKMFQDRDPFVMQTHYMHNPITDSRGFGTKFGNLPILEWLLFIGYLLLNTLLPLEMITRLVMTFVGALSLLTIYLFLKNTFSTKTAITTLALLTVNQIFNLASFVTVYDTINIGITFFSYYLLTKYQQNSKLQLLVFAGLILGIGASIKENILIWALPTIFIMLLKRKEPLKNYLADFMSIVLLSMLPILITKFSINYFPTKEVKYFIFFFIGILFLAILIKYFKYIYSSIGKFLDGYFKLTEKKKYLILLPILTTPIFIYLLYQSDIAEEFLTDGRLLFNIDLYIYFASYQIVPYISIFVAFLAIFSVILLPLYEKLDKRNKILFSLIFGSLVYIIVASKVLFFHSYYWLYIIIALTLLGAKSAIIFSEQFINNSTKNLFLLMMLFSIIIPMLNISRSKLGREYKSVYQVIEYIESQNDPEGTSFIDQGDLTYLSFKTKLFRVYDSTVFANNEFKMSVEESGLASAMEKYKIKYLITTANKEPDYLIFANTFSRENLLETSYRRTDIIYSELYPTKYKYYSDSDIREDILDANGISNQFYLAQSFKDYNIYKLRPACFEVIIK